MFEKLFSSFENQSKRAIAHGIRQYVTNIYENENGETIEPIDGVNYRVSVEVAEGELE